MFLIKIKINKSNSLPVQNDHEPTLVVLSVTVPVSEQVSENLSLYLKIRVKIQSFLL